MDVESLKTLELNVLSSFDDFYVPKHISLPQLKRLKLGGVTFSKDYNHELLSLSNCPVLQDLTLECCRWVDVRSFCISAPSIEHLKIISAPNGGDEQDDRDYISGLRDSSLKIHAPRLVSLTYKDSIPKNFVLSSSLTLAEADVDELYFWGNHATETREQQIGVGAAAIRFLQLLSHVKVLSIADRLLKLNVSAEANDGKALVALLRSTPILESLVFNETVSSKQFTGEDLEMWWVKLILEKAKALQTMTIFHYVDDDDPTAKDKEEVGAGLSSLFKASATSYVLNFS
ncbi:F-box/LRR-repeat protein At4g14096-like [Papaver somniferum]|uniref:F-box/LRR-repeat protein At4g14096-like n=1 Tax=Papaver somniferum TaxID=3469 RepID=UPI000E705544|nr:F-box/LRR-repeat protein At4g14096-like [Papaver somniferum]